MTLADYLPVLDDLRRRGSATAAVAYDALATIVERMRQIADAVAAYEAATVTVVAVPFAEVRTTTTLIDAFVAAYLPDLDYPPDLFTVLRAAAVALWSLQALRRAFASQATLTGMAPNVFVATPAPLVPYRLRQGDTVERLAHAFLSDLERSWEIIDLNTLVYPYLDTTRDLTHPDFAAQDFSAEFERGGQPDRDGVPDGVRVTGETIWLPADAHVPTYLQVATDHDVELFGRDLRLENGMLVVSAIGEFATVDGQANVIQALGNRLATMRGELLLHPDYGMEQAIALGVEGTRTNAILAGLETARTTLQDPRVVAVRNLEVVFTDTTDRAAMVVALISGRTIPLNLVLPESGQTP